MADSEIKNGNRTREKPRGVPSYRTQVWRRSQRATLHSAHRYSIFVKVMKGALPVAAVALGGAVLAYTLQPRDSAHMALTFERVDEIKDDRAMVRPRLIGTDDDGLPFVITAASATQMEAASDSVKLTDVVADFTTKDGKMLHVTAAQGIVDTKQHLFDISGGIHLTSSDGYDAKTEMASADLKAGTVHGEKRIEAEGKFGRIAADRFAYNRETKKVQFTGHVSMLINKATR